MHAVADEKSCFVKPVFWDCRWLDTELMSFNNVNTILLGISVDNLKGKS